MMPNVAPAMTNEIGRSPSRGAVRAVNRASTLHDVAARVGVSPRTVSRVVNDQGGFSEATRARVLDAVEELSYRPNVMARGLITRRSGTIAFIAGVLNDPFFPEVADSVHNAARRADLTMLFATNNSDPDLELDVLGRLEAHAPDGVILFPALGSATHLHRFLDRGMRMVVVDAPVEHENASSIQTDLRTGVRLAVEHLVARGARQLAMIANPHSPIGHRRRQPAFVEALPDGMEVIVESVAPTFEGGKEATRRLLERAPHVDEIGRVHV